MKILFFGTPQYVIPVLQMLHKKYNKPNEKQLIGVVTQPPKQVGREKIITRSEVDNWGYKHKIDVFHELNNLPDADLGVVAAYGKIIPQEVISQFKYGLLNIHPSLLPQFRGASPIQSAIATDTNPTGLSVIKMDAEMDHGPVVSQFKEYIEEEDTNESVREKMFVRAAEFLEELLPAYLNGKIKPREQDHDKATFTTLIKKEHGFIPPELLKEALVGRVSSQEWQVGFIKGYTQLPTARLLSCFIRALSPWPNAWSNIHFSGTQEKRIKILKAHNEDETLVLDEVQLEGKNPVSWMQFKQGYKEASF